MFSTSQPHISNISHQYIDNLKEFSYQAHYGAIISETAHNKNLLNPPSSIPMQSHSHDILSLSKQSRLISQLQKQQKILFSCETMKFNDANKCQPRIFMISDVAVYNLQKGENFIKSMMSKLVNFNKKFTIRRKILFNTIQAITLSTCEQSGEFVLHVRDDYDYRFQIDDKNVKKLLLKCLCLQYEKLMKKKMSFYFKDDITLLQYCTMKQDLKHKISRVPKQNRVFLNVQDLADYQVPGATFEPLYSYNNKFVEISKFVSSSLEKMKQNHKYFSIQSKNASYQDIIPYLENRHQFINLPHYIYRVKQKLYLLRPIMIGGKMDKLVSSLGSFKTQLCIFYIAQIILVLEYLHSRKWVYRATSLSNIYIKDNGYIAIDGMNKLMRKKSKPNQLFYDMCGLPEDLAPEMIMCRGHDESSDVWGLGVCAYNMIEGHHPFVSYNVKQTFKKILQKKIEESEFLPSFVLKSLDKDPKLRPSLAQIKKDPCFNLTNWQQIEKQVKISPYIPELNSVFNWQGKLPSILSLEENKK